MSVLVTGGAGFIGAHVARALQERGEEVVLFDDLNPYYDPQLKQARVERLTRPRTFLRRGDVADQDSVEKLVREVMPSTVVHCAAWAGVRASRRYPALFARTNVIGTVNVLHACVQAGVRQVIVASSSSVYDRRTPVPFREDAVAGHPLSPYGVSKLAAEQYAHVAHSLEGLSVTCLRFFTVYGPWGRPDMSYWRFTERVLAGVPLVLHTHAADGLEIRRDFTNIQDIVRGVLAALDTPQPFAVVNLGTATSVRLRDVVAIIEDVLGKRATIREEPLPPGEAVETAADVTRAHALFQYQPSVELAAGLRRFVTWYADEFRPAFPRGLASSQFWS